MMIVLCILFTLIFGSLEAQAYTPPSGFRGIAWGTELQAMTGAFYVLTTHGDTTVYARYGEPLSIGEANLQRINYICYKGRFYGVRVSFEGSSNWHPIKEALTQTHGPGIQPNRFMETYVWGLQAMVRIHLDYSRVSEKGTLTFIFGPIAQEQSRDDQQKGKAAGKDL